MLQTGFYGSLFDVLEKKREVKHEDATRLLILLHPLLIRAHIYVGPHIGTGPVLELGPIFRPVLELGRGRPHTGTHCAKLIGVQGTTFTF